jgi:hypothetical protein
MLHCVIVVVYNTYMVAFAPIHEKENEMEQIIYALEQGETRDYMETIIYTGEQLPNNWQAIAEQKGFHTFRIAKFNWGAPNFANTLNA